jgi:hypothetical protein
MAAANGKNGAPKSSGLVMALLAATVVGGGGGGLLGFGVIGPMIPEKGRGSVSPASTEASGESEKPNGESGGKAGEGGNAHGDAGGGHGDAGGGHGDAGGGHGDAGGGHGDAGGGHGDAGGGHGDAGGGHGDAAGGHGAAAGGHGDAAGANAKASAAHRGDAKGHVKELPAIVTNLSGADRHWVRLQSAIIYDPDELPHIEPMIAELSADITAFLGTLDLSNIEGPDGLRRLQEELSERIAIRSERRVRGFLIETLVVQ